MGGEFVQVRRKVLGAKSSNACVVFMIGMKSENIIVHLLLGRDWSVVGSTLMLCCGEGARQWNLEFTGCHRP